MFSSRQGTLDDLTLEAQAQAQAQDKHMDYHSEPPSPGKSGYTF